MVDKWRLTLWLTTLPVDRLIRLSNGVMASDLFEPERNQYMFMVGKHSALRPKHVHKLKIECS